MLIANMAMSDLLFPIFLFPLRLAEFRVGSWIIGGALGQALCKLHIFLANVSGVVSIQSLVLIAVDRFGAVVVPLRSPLITRKLCPFFIIATWITAMAVFSPLLVAYKLVKYRERLMCVRLWMEFFGGSTFANYFLAVAVVFLFIPFVLVVIFYSIILMKLKMQAHPGEQSANAEEKRTRRNRNVLKMATAIIVGFFIFWIPYFSSAVIVNFSAPDSSISFSCSFYLFYIVTNYMIYANCAINPIICLTFSKALKIELTVAYSFILVVSLVGNFLIVLIVYKTPTLRKPINMLIANMAISDLLFPIILFPVRLVDVQVGSWLIGGNLGQALCKLHFFGTYISSLVSVQSLVLITVDRFGAVVVPLRSPLITSKQCPFFIVATWIIAMAVHSPYLAVSKLVEYPGGMRCTSQWRETLGANANINFVLVVAIVFFYTPFVLLAILYSVILIKLKRQAHPGEASANAEEQRTRRIRNVLKMAIANYVVSFAGYHCPVRG
ncbi:unnamed protein product [Porites lobata]|uniref:G-protein coupled receptors family 1 profile domain-containing protein n=1 Tax=Porites lobata TaxID=104759 RepID=A0ABN8RT79_9CNID|nr:unnamed protein product [Porites lobata]